MAGHERTFFQASEIAALVGMPEKRLIKFVESPGYGIRPSVRAKAGKGAPRLYSRVDLFRIALAWWLFQTGFRSQVIGRVLKSKALASLLPESRRWRAEAANEKLLLVKREMAPDEPPVQEVFVASPSELLSTMDKADRHGLQILPIGSLLTSLWARLRASESEGD